MLREIVDMLTSELRLSNAERIVLADELAKARTELNGINALVAGFLETMIGQQVPPDRFAATLFVDAGAQLRSLAEPRADTTTSTGRLMIAVLGGPADRALPDRHPHGGRPEPSKGARAPLELRNREVHYGLEVDHGA
jgi:hypothetical protein